MWSLGDKSGERAGTQHRGEEVKSGSKVGRRDNATLPFRTVYPEKGRVVTSSLCSPLKRVKISTWSRSVNSEDFLIA